MERIASSRDPSSSPGVAAKDIEGSFSLFQATDLVVVEWSDSWNSSAP